MTPREAPPDGLPTARLFDRLADVYDRFTTGLRSDGSSVDRWIAEHLPAGGRALDVGCGSGRYTTVLADRCDEVLGIDAAPAMVERATARRARPNVRYAVRRLEDLDPDTDGAFDVVLSFSCVLHVGNPEHTLAHLRRLVAPGGVFLVVEPGRPPGWGEPGWQADLAFSSARAVYDGGGDIGAAQSALALFLDPDWLRISEMSVPLTEPELRATFDRVLPGATVDGDLLLGATAACWRNDEP